MQATLRKCVLSVAAIAVFVIPSWGQTMIRTITRFRVIPGQTGYYEAAVKEYNEVLRKAGWPQPMTRWRSSSGPSEYALTTYWSKYADLDKVMLQDPKLKDYAGQLAASYARVLACGESADRIIDEIQPDLSILSNDPPPLVRVLRTVVKPDRVNDFTALLKNEALPAAQKSGAKLYMVSRTRLGGLGTEFRSMVGVDSWANLEEGLSVVRRGMSPEKFASFQQKWGSMVVEYQYDVYRYQPDLSYIPARPTATSNR